MLQNVKTAESLPKIDFFEFTEEEVEYLSKKAMLNEDYKKMFKMLVKGEYGYIIADELSVCDRTFYRMKKKLIRKIKRVL